jgi:UDP-glucose 4-epimerase
MVTILVVGGAGFIGSHVNHMLHEAGYKTIVFDNLSRGHRETVLQGTFIQGDIGDTEALKAVFQNYSIDAVMHFAAFIDVGESVLDPAKYYKNNVANTLTLLQTMLQYGVKRFIFSSSAAVYGYPQEDKITESHPCSPISPYGGTKWIVEKILHNFKDAYDLEFCCLRYFNAAGGDPHGIIKNYQTQVTNLIPLTLRRIQSNRPTTIFGTNYPTPDGTCIRDYIHVYDLGTAHILAMERLMQGGASGCYNLGNGQGYSVKEVIAAIQEVTGKSVSVIEGERRPGDPPILLANALKAQQEWGWQPRYFNLKEIIVDAWKALL